jgi:DNA-binding transcriptional LysR family regulator
LLEIGVRKYGTMHYRLDDILAFLQVMETGSISTAAQRMGLSKSIISTRITNLETVLKVELLHRSTRGVMPTDKGDAFYQRARLIMRQLDQAAEELIEQDDELCGSLRMAAPMTFGTTYLGPILFSFISRYPRLELALDLDDRITDLAGEGYDLGVRIGRLRDSSLVARKLAVSRRVVCCSPAYAQRAGLPAMIEELSNHACIGYVNVSPGQIWQFEPKEPGGAPRTLVVRSRIIANNGESMRDAAIAGLGISILPVFIAAKALASGQLINALPDANPVADTIYAVYPRNRHLPRKVRAIIDHLVAVFEGVPPWERELTT